MSAPCECGCELAAGDERHGRAVGYNLKCRCTPCRAAKAERNRAWREANRERDLERQRAYREANRERDRERKRAYHEANRARAAEYSRAWREANRERDRERKRAYREANRDRVVEYSRAYYETHRQAYFDHAAARRARKRDATVGTVRRAEVYERDWGLCHLCLEKVDPDNWHMDHLIPLVRGGAHSMDNVAVTHPACNLRKGTRLPDEL